MALERIPRPSEQAFRPKRSRRSATLQASAPSADCRATRPAPARASGASDRSDCRRCFRWRYCAGAIAEQAFERAIFDDPTRACGSKASTHWKAAARPSARCRGDRQAPIAACAERRRLPARSPAMNEPNAPLPVQPNTAPRRPPGSNVLFRSVWSRWFGRRRAGAGRAMPVTLKLMLLKTFNTSAQLEVGRRREPLGHANVEARKKGACRSSCARAITAFT